MVTRLPTPAIRFLAASPPRSAHPPCRLIVSLIARPPPPCTHFRPFTSTCIRRQPDNTPNHYQILNLPPSCTPAELKKQFYLLSKETHPDINRHDPHASRRFSQISESYSILADPEKRRRYDRSLPSTSPSPRPGGSYAGSRPASGLSKRRGPFRGPPPSFYAHGNPSANSSSASSSSAAGPGQGRGSFTSTGFDEGPVDFDSTPTYKTQTHEDTRRQSRRAAALAAASAEAEDERDFWVRFAVVTGVVVLGITVATLIGSVGGPRGGFLRSDGSRRGENRNNWTKGD